MNKALHVFVYLFLILACVALWFEFQLNDKRTELRDRNRLQEDFVIDVARMTEDGADETGEKAEPVKLDVLPVTKEEVGRKGAEEEDGWEDVLKIKEYDYALEKIERTYLKWGDAEREKLRRAYVLDAEGKPELDGSQKRTRDSDEDMQLRALVNALKKQHDKLQDTRKALTALREKIEELVPEYNDLKFASRQDKKDIFDLSEAKKQLEEKKTDLENQIVKIKAQIDELNAEITSLKDEVVTAHDETEAAKEALAKEQQLTTQLKKLVQEYQKQLAGGAGGAGPDGGRSITSLPAGDKGKVIVADNNNMFAILELTPQAMKELKGEDMTRPMPSLELGVRRGGFEGPAQEFVGRVRIRQEVAGKNYVVCDILSNWSQDTLEVGDVVFAE